MCLILLSLAYIYIYIYFRTLYTLMYTCDGRCTGTWCENDGEKHPFEWAMDTEMNIFRGQWFQDIKRGSWDGRKLALRQSAAQDNNNNSAADNAEERRLAGLSPLVDVVVLGPGVPTPQGYEKIEVTAGGRDASLNTGNG